MTANGTIIATETSKGINVTYMLSGANVRNLLNLFDIRVLFSLMRENLGTLLSVSNPLHNQTIVSNNNYYCLVIF